MREFTKELRKEREIDVRKINQHRNGKISRRSKEQNEQSHNDKKAFYFKKWNELLLKSETDAQKNICKEMIGRIERMTKWFR